MIMPTERIYQKEAAPPVLPREPVLHGGALYIWLADPPWILYKVLRVKRNFLLDTRTSVRGWSAPGKPSMRGDDGRGTHIIFFSSEELPSLHSSRSRSRNFWRLLEPLETLHHIANILETSENNLLSHSRHQPRKKL